MQEKNEKNGEKEGDDEVLASKTKSQMARKANKGAPSGPTKDVPFTCKLQTTTSMTIIVKLDHTSS